MTNGVTALTGRLWICDDRIRTGASGRSTDYGGRTRRLHNQDGEGLELVKLEHWGRKWTWTCFRHGNGSKQLGFRFWWNDQRVGLEMNFGVRELSIMREWD